MRFFRALCLVLLGSLLLAQAMSKDADAEQFDEEEEEEDDSEDGVVETEDEATEFVERPMYERPLPNGPTHFAEPFDTRAEFLKRWVLSQAKKDGVEDTVAKYDGKWEIEEPAENPIQRDLGLILKSKAKHHAIAAKLDRPFEFSGRPFIAQYEVRFQSGMDCGGAYMKLLTSDNKLNLKTFHDKTPYTIMFGPDKCGNDVKLHFIFRHRNPKTGEFEEKHAEKPTAKLDTFFTDRKTHLYTLIVRPDNSFEIKVDNGLVSSGNLLENFSPPVNPPKEIEDPNDKKPSDWDDREKIPDPDAKKPSDWDESEPATIVDEDAEMPEGWLADEEVYIPDPTATKPEDWDDEMDGEWEAPRIDNPVCKEAPGCGKWEPPTIANPKYKGVWKAPMIDNPAYRGEWKPRVIPNPNYFEDTEPYRMAPIGAVGLELWSMTDNIIFDNFIVSDNESVVEDFTAITWEVKSNSERAAASTGGWWYSLKKAAETRPWLWAIYVVVLLIPVVLLSICLCPRSGPVKPEDIAAHKKKFDDPNPDTIEEEGEEEAQQQEEEVEGGESKEDTAAGGDAEAAGGTEEESKDTGAAGDGNTADGEEEGEDGTAQGSPKKSSSPRRRKARKE